MVNKIKGSIYYFLDILNLSISVLLCLAFPIFYLSSLSLLLHKRSMKLISIKNITEDLPKPQTETTLNIIMESPITPLALITGVGVLAISLTTLKALVWALRTIPK